MIPNERAPVESAEIASRRVCDVLNVSLPDGWGFILWLVSFGEKGVATYTTDIEKDQAIRIMEEWLEMQKGAEMPDTLDGVDRKRNTCWLCSSTSNIEILRGPHRSVAICSTCIECGSDHGLST